MQGLCGTWQSQERLCQHPKRADKLEQLWTTVAWLVYRVSNTRHPDFHVRAQTCVHILLPVATQVLEVALAVGIREIAASDPTADVEALFVHRQIVNIICVDGINTTLGILNLVFLNDPEVKEWVRSQGGKI